MERQWISSRRTNKIPRLNEKQIVYFSFFFMFKFHKANHGKRARTKSRTADHARNMLEQLKCRLCLEREESIPHMIVAMTARFKEQPLLGIRGSQIDSTGVHCANTVTARIMLRTMILTIQNQRKSLCLGLISQGPRTSSLRNVPFFDDNPHEERSDSALAQTHANCYNTLPSQEQ